MLTLETLEVVGSILGGIGVVAFGLNKADLLHFGKRAEYDGCESGFCKDHGALVESMTGIKDRIDHQDTKLDQQSAKLDRMSEDTAFIRGLLEGGKK